MACKLTDAEKRAYVQTGWCPCEGACMLTRADCWRLRIKCRYRHGSVKPIEQLTKAGADRVRELVAQQEGA